MCISEAVANLSASWHVATERKAHSYNVTK